MPGSTRITLRGVGHTAADNSRQPSRVATELRAFFFQPASRESSATQSLRSKGLAGWGGPQPACGGGTGLMHRRCSGTMRSTGLCGWGAWRSSSGRMLIDRCGHNQRSWRKAMSRSGGR